MNTCIMSISNFSLIPVNLKWLSPGSWAADNRNDSYNKILLFNLHSGFSCFSQINDSCPFIPDTQLSGASPLYSLSFVFFCVSQVMTVSSHVFLSSRRLVPRVFIIALGRLQVKDAEFMSVLSLVTPFFLFSSLFWEFSFSSFLSFSLFFSFGLSRVLYFSGHHRGMRTPTIL